MLLPNRSCHAGGEGVREREDTSEAYLWLESGGINCEKDGGGESGGYRVASYSRLLYLQIDIRENCCHCRLINQHRGGRTDASTVKTKGSCSKDEKARL